VVKAPAGWMSTFGEVWEVVSGGESVRGVYLIVTAAE
jgi:hypothetical protein